MTKVRGEHLQFVLDQLLHVAPHSLDLLLVRTTVVPPVLLHVFIQVSLSDFRRIAGDIPGATGGIQETLPLVERVSHPNEVACKLPDDFGYFSLALNARAASSVFPLASHIELRVVVAPTPLYRTWQHRGRLPFDGCAYPLKNRAKRLSHPN